MDIWMQSALAGRECVTQEQLDSSAPADFAAVGAEVDAERDADHLADARQEEAGK
jgi:hypothetical protein